MKTEPLTRRTRARALAVVPLAALVWVVGAAAAESPALKLVQTIPLKGPAGRLDHMALDAKHGRLFVANMANSSLDVVDLKAGKLVKQVPGQKGIQGIAYAPNLDRIFVGNEAGGVFNVFDGRDYRLLKTIKFEGDADNVRYEPHRQLVYVAHAEKAVAVVDAKAIEVRADIKVPGQPEAFLLEKARPRLYLNTPSTREVIVIDTLLHQVLARHPLRSAGGNYPLALDEAGHRLFVGCRKPPAVVVLDADSGKEVARVAIPGDTDDLFFDGRRGRLYASCGEGFLAVVGRDGAGRYKLLAKVATVKGARTALFDAGAGRLYLAVPRREGREGPEVWVYRVPNARADGDRQRRAVPFGKGDLGKLPTGWKVVEDDTAPSATGHALAQTAVSPSAFKCLCLARDTSYRDVRVRVAFRAVKGIHHRGGGVVWRYRDRHNYYLAQANLWEEYLRVYKVMDGRRIELGNKRGLKASQEGWHTLEVEMCGNGIRCSLDGTRHIDITDATLPGAGKVGLWTRGNAQTYFDDFVVRALTE